MIFCKYNFFHTPQWREYCLLPKLIFPLSLLPGLCIKVTFHKIQASSKSVPPAIYTFHSNLQSQSGKAVGSCSKCLWYIASPKNENTLEFYFKYP